ncbi:MAG: hypothetical protein ACSHX8_05980 [Opitutaceae bacterium]
MAEMKIRLELPCELLRRAETAAADGGQTLDAFIASSIEAMITNYDKPREVKTWMAFAGSFSDKEESRRILAEIEQSQDHSC